MSKKDQAHAHRWQNRVHNWLIMPQSSGTIKQRPVTMDELAKHKTGGASKDMWMAVNGYVYDVTRFAQFHPGGVLLMQKYSGMDATVVYAKNHTNVPPEDVIGNYKIGPLVAGSAPAAVSTPAPGATNTNAPPQTSTRQEGSASSLRAPSGPSLTVPTSAPTPSAPPMNITGLRFPPSAAAEMKYERQPHKNPSSSTALLEPLGEIVAAARGSRLFDAVPDDELAAACLASRNVKRTKRDARNPQSAHGPVEGTPSEAAVMEDEADDLASIECVFDLLDAEQKGSVRLDQLEAFLVNIGGFPDAKAAREGVKDKLSTYPSVKATGRITKAQFVEITNSL